MCGLLVHQANRGTLAAHWSCVVWWRNKTNTEHNSYVTSREYQCQELKPMMFHTEFVEAIGTMVQQTSAAEVAELLGVDSPLIHDTLLLRKNVSGDMVDALNYRRVPIYIRADASPIPMDLALNSNNFNRAY